MVYMFHPTSKLRHPTSGHSDWLNEHPYWTYCRCKEMSTHLVTLAVLPVQLFDQGNDACEGVDPEVALHHPQGWVV